MRALIFELRPESLQNEGLVAALTKQSDAMRDRHKLNVETHFDPEPEISLESKEALYRITQEALQNIAKHAHATRVELTLQERDGQLVLEIRDNGKGFDTSREFPGHLGLRSMPERAAQIGSEFQIQSLPGEGTVITVRSIQSKQYLISFKTLPKGERFVFGHQPKSGSSFSALRPKINKGALAKIYRDDKSYWR